MRSIYYRGLTPDGLAYGSVVYEGSVDQEADGRLGSAVLTDLKTGHMQTLYDGRKDPSAGVIWAMAASPGWVVWALTKSKDVLYENDWTLYSYERATGRTRKLAQAPKLGTVSVPPAYGGTFPGIIGGEVYLGAVSSLKKSGEQVNGLYAVPLNGSEPLRLVRKDVDNVQIAGGQVAYAHKDHFYWLDVATGVVRKLPNVTPEGANGWNASEGGLAWAETDTPEPMLRVQKVNGDRLDAGNVERPGHIVSTERWVAFAEPTPDYFSTYYVYDLKRRKMFHIPDGLVDTPSGRGDIMILPVTDSDHEARETVFVKLR